MLVQAMRVFAETVPNVGQISDVVKMMLYKPQSTTWFIIHFPANKMHTLSMNVTQQRWYRCPNFCCLAHGPYHAFLLIIVLCIQGSL